MNDELQEKINAVLMRVPEFVGWYDKPGDEPAHTPPSGAPCPICWRPTTEVRRWASLMPMNSSRSMFYAMHPECSALGDCEARQIADVAVLDWSEMQ